MLSVQKTIKPLVTEKFLFSQRVKLQLTLLEIFRSDLSWYGTFILCRMKLAELTDTFSNVILSNYIYFKNYLLLVLGVRLLRRNSVQPDGKIRILISWTGPKQAGGIPAKTVQRSIRYWNDRDHEANMKSIFRHNAAKHFLGNPVLQELGLTNGHYQLKDF